ncbi:MAG: helix-turn-helix domain-containing protein [Pseudohongiellaceae bacterium]
MAYKLFADNQRVPLKAWLLIAAYQIALAILPIFWVASDTVYTSVSRPAYIIMFAMGIHVIVMALAGRADDLILKRRRLRVPFAIGMGFICASLFGSVFFVSVLNSESVPLLGPTTYIFCIFSIFIFTLTANLIMVSLFADTPQFSLLINWDDKNQIPVAPSQHGINPRTIQRISEQMEVEKLYQDPELTITGLASKTAIKEHKLRKIINTGMGYRNFNQFLNNYRIREACQLLLSEERADLTISLISFEVGYASLSSFNKAFKEITGITPSAYRNNPELSQFQPLKHSFSPE